MAHVVSDTPGRLRVRLPPERRNRQFAGQLHDHLVGQLGHSEVKVTIPTGSVTIHYDPHRHTVDDVVAMLRDVGVIMEGVSEGAEPQDILEHLGTSSGAQSVIQALDDLNRRVSLYTGRRVDLRFLFPLTLGALGFYKAARSGLQLADVPAAILLYYAFDSFQKLHAIPPRSGESGRAMASTAKGVATAAAGGAE